MERLEEAREKEKKGIAYTWEHLTWGDFFWSISIWFIFMTKLIYKMGTWIFRVMGKLAKTMEKKDKELERRYGRV